MIKDTIELRSPKKEGNSNRADLKQACLRLQESTRLWKDYAIKNHIPVVVPLLVVQVEDRISDQSIEDLCRAIINNIPNLNGTLNFANVFGRHEDIITKFINVPYVKPDEVYSNTDIKVLFAKDAISTGWDCPRAEVIYSQRSRKDPTYIAQLIGRMVRTPLARRIETVEELNTVSCYLPEFDEASVQEVVEHLKDDAITSSTEVFANPVRVRPFGDTRKSPQVMVNSGEAIDDKFDGYSNSAHAFQGDHTKNRENLGTEYEESPSTRTDKFRREDNTGKQTGNMSVNNEESNQATPGRKESPLYETPDSVLDATKETINSDIQYPKISDEDGEKIKQVFENINTRPIVKEKPDYFRDLVRAIDLISASLDPKANLNASLQKDFDRKLDSSIVYREDEFSKSLASVTTFIVSVKKVDPLTGKTIENQEELATNDLDSSFNAYMDALKKVSGGSDLGNNYINEFTKKHGGNQQATEEGIWRFTAAMETSEILIDLDDWAHSYLQNLISQYRGKDYGFSDTDKAKWDKIVGNVNPYVDGKLILSAASTHQEASNKAYPKHIICDDQGRAYIKLSPLEEKVVYTEISGPMNIAWYRNTARNRNGSLAIPYNLGGEWKPMYPDFIFFQKTVTGKVVPVIVDPHGEWLGDSIAKLRGYVEYLQDFPDTFGAVQVVTDLDDSTCRYLDLKDAKVQKAICEFNGSSAAELFTGPLSNPYKFSKLK